MAGRLNISTGVLPSTHGLGAQRAQGQSRNADRPLAGRMDMPRRDAKNYPHPSQRTSGGNSYQGGYGNGSVGVVIPERARAVRSAGYGAGKLGGNQPEYRPNAPYHTGTPANLQRPHFDNWSAKKPSLLGETGSCSKIVYWGDLKERDDKMAAMRAKYDLNDERRALIREVFIKMDIDADGLVTIDDLKQMYIASTHPLVRSGRWREQDVFKDIIARFKGSNYEVGTTQKFSALSLQEFEEYYRRVGEDLDDEYFAAMIMQAWRLHRPAGARAPEQGWGGKVMERLSVYEANLLGADYPGPQELKRQKLQAVVVSDEDLERVELRRQKLQAVVVSDEDLQRVSGWAAAARGGEYGAMARAAAEVRAYVGVNERIGGFPNEVPGNAVRFMRLGGAEIMADLAVAADDGIKRTAADALLAALTPELARLELAARPEPPARLVREGLPALLQCNDPVARNKAQRVQTLLQ